MRSFLLWAMDSGFGVRSHSSGSANPSLHLGIPLFNYKTTRRSKNVLKSCYAFVFCSNISQTLSSCSPSLDQSHTPHMPSTRRNLLRPTYNSPPPHLNDTPQTFLIRLHTLPTLPQRRRPHDVVRRPGPARAVLPPLPPSNVHLRNHARLCPLIHL